MHPVVLVPARAGGPHHVPPRCTNRALFWDIHCLFSAFLSAKHKRKQTMSKNIVCIKQSLAKSPRYEGEYLDLVTALASFDYHIDLVFQDDGVFSLFTSNNNRIHDKRLQSLPLFDIHDIWVNEDSLISRQLAKSKLCITANVASKNTIDTLLQRQNVGIIYV